MSGQYGKWVSDNYVAGSMGWMVNADGSAEFLNITARGIIMSGSPTGKRVELSSDTIRFYNLLNQEMGYIEAYPTILHFETDEGIDFYAGGNGIFGIYPLEIWVSVDILPTNFGGINIGNATYYFGDISYKTLTDRVGIFKANPNESYDLIKNLEADTLGKCRMIEKRGQRRLKFSKFPKYMFDDALEEAKEDIIFDENIIIDNQVGYKKFEKGQIIAKKGEKTRWRIIKNKNNDGKKHIIEASEGLEISAFISHLAGTVQKLIKDKEVLEKKVEVLENK